MSVCGLPITGSGAQACSNAGNSRHRRACPRVKWRDADVVGLKGEGEPAEGCSDGFVLRGSNSNAIIQHQRAHPAHGAAVTVGLQEMGKLSKDTQRHTLLAVCHEQARDGLGYSHSIHTPLKTIRDRTLNALSSRKKRESMRDCAHASSAPHRPISDTPTPTLPLSPPGSPAMLDAPAFQANPLTATPAGVCVSITRDNTPCRASAGMLYVTECGEMPTVSMSAAVLADTDDTSACTSVCNRYSTQTHSIRA